MPKFQVVFLSVSAVAIGFVGLRSSVWRDYIIRLATVAPGISPGMGVSEVLR
jgi:hypothetical protein